MEGCEAYIDNLQVREESNDIFLAILDSNKRLEKCFMQ